MLASDDHRLVLNSPLRLPHCDGGEPVFGKVAPSGDAALEEPVSGLGDLPLAGVPAFVPEGASFEVMSEVEASPAPPPSSPLEHPVVKIKAPAIATAPTENFI